MESSYYIIALLVMVSTITIFMGLRMQRIHRENAISAALNGGVAGPPSLRELELAKPRAERLFMPFLRHMHGLGRMLTPTRNLMQLQHDLILAGFASRLSLTDFLGLRFLSGLAFGAILFLTSSNRPLFSVLLIAFAGFMVGLYIPNLWLRSKVRSRQHAIARSLPDALDMMSICVDAGLGFEAAMQKVAMQWDTELSLEFQRVINEIRLGIPRIEALHNLIYRTGVTDVANFVAVLIQADKLGIAIKDVLHTQAEQMRIRRRQRAEEAAQKAPLKMLFPLVFFIFPAMFAIILGPTIPRFLRIFG
ncbi:MAG: type II secretion system F family protein [Caldilineaceae bacterium]